MKVSEVMHAPVVSTTPEVTLRGHQIDTIADTVTAQSTDVRG